jgi:hypothetical protein
MNYSGNILGWVTSMFCVTNCMIAGLPIHVVHEINVLKITCIYFFKINEQLLF